MSLTTEEKTQTDNTISLVAVKNKKLEEQNGPSNLEIMSKAMEIFEQEIKDDAKGFLSIIFDKENNPRILWAGEIEMLTSIGALEVAKSSLMSGMSTIEE